MNTQIIRTYHKLLLLIIERKILISFQTSKHTLVLELKFFFGTNGGGRLAIHEWTSDSCVRYSMSFPSKDTSLHDHRVRIEVCLVPCCLAGSHCPSTVVL
jgi:hypothetical protein